MNEDKLFVECSRGWASVLKKEVPSSFIFRFILYFFIVIVQIY